MVHGHTTSKIFVIGGTGAQGFPVIGALVADRKYSVRALSRDRNSRRANALLGLGNVSILEGTFADDLVRRIEQEIQFESFRSDSATEYDASVDTPIAEKQLEFGKPEAQDN